MMLAAIADESDVPHQPPVASSGCGVAFTSAAPELPVMALFVSGPWLGFCWFRTPMQSLSATTLSVNDAWPESKTAASPESQVVSVITFCVTVGMLPASTAVPLPPRSRLASRNVSPPTVACERRLPRIWVPSSVKESEKVIELMTLSTIWLPALLFPTNAPSSRLSLKTC